jgi:hypothetical protein
MACQAIAALVIKLQQYLATVYDPSPDTGGEMLSQLALRLDVCSRQGRVSRRGRWRENGATEFTTSINPDPNAAQCARIFMRSHAVLSPASLGIRYAPPRASLGGCSGSRNAKGPEQNHIIDRHNV